MSLHISDVLAPERTKYDEIWSTPEYNASLSPGLENVERFMNVIKPALGASLIDIGCGTGKAGLEFERRGLQVSWMDLTAAALDADVDQGHFADGPVWGHAWRGMRPNSWDYGFCCDVLEHIPTEYTMLAVERILRSCRTAWLQIAFKPDALGALIGKPLHLTVQPFTWWRDRIATLGSIMDARDLCGHGLFVVKR